MHAGCLTYKNGSVMYWRNVRRGCDCPSHCNGSLFGTCPLARVLIDSLAMCLQVTVDFPIVADPGCEIAAK